ncbi:MAG: zinc ABC transporter substrate-binding protein [Bacilli bacterium]
MKKLQKLIASLVLALTLIISSGCNGDDVIPDIYTSIYPIEYIAGRIVEDDLVVRSIYPRGKDVHDYELSPKDMIKISKSKLLFYIGAGLEGLIEQSLDTTLKDVPTISLSEGLNLVEINSEHHHDEDEHEHHQNEDGVFYDPHIWLDLDKMHSMTTRMLVHIVDTFDLTEEQKTRFTNNANALKADLLALDQDFFDVINSSDVKDKTIIVDHDAYIYWEVRYGLQRMRIRNDNESTDAIPKDMIEKINIAKEKNIKHICLTKNEMPSSIANQYKTQLELGSDGFLFLHHLATITADEQKQGLDYMSIMQDNLEVLSKALPKK